MTIAEWLQLAKEGGGILSPFLIAALIWLNMDRNRLIADCRSDRAKIDDLSERLLTITAELKTFLFSERKA